MAPRSRAQQSPRINPPADFTREQDELAGQGPVQKFNAGSNEAPTKPLTLPEALTPPLVPSSTEDLCTKFMKVFMEMTQAQVLAEPQE